MYPKTNTKTKTLQYIQTDFSRLEGYQSQLHSILLDSEFAIISKDLQGSVVRIFSKKIEVLLSDITHIVSTPVASLDDQQLDQIVERLGFAQQFIYEEKFFKSIETYVDLYVMSDSEEEIKAYRNLEVFFQELISDITQYLESIDYASYIGRLNAVL